MNDIDQLTHYLHARAGAADLGHTPIGVITRAGTRRRNRHRAVSTAGVLAVGSLGTVAAVQTLGSGGGNPRQVSTDPVATNPSPASTIVPDPAMSVAPAADNTLVPSPLVWNAVDVDSAETLNTLTWITDTTSNNELGPYYRMSTAPARAATETPGYYQSADGIHWEHLGDDDPDRPDAVYSGRSVGSVDGRRYVLDEQHGGRDAAPALSAPTVDVSDDGVAWQERALPFDLESLATQPGVSSVDFTSGGVAGQGTTVVVGAVVTTRVDEASVAELLDAPGSIGRDEDGVGFVQYATTPIDCAELRGLLDEWQQGTVDDAPDVAGVIPLPPRPGAQVSPDECYRWGAELRRISPEDVGLTAEASAAAFGTPLLFASTDDGEFVQVSAPLPPAGEDVARFGIVADDAGYVAVISTYQAIYAYRTDAAFSTWQQIGNVIRPDGGAAMIGSIGSVGGNVVTVYQSVGGATINTLQGDTWVSHTVADLLPDDVMAMEWNQAAVGTNGVALVGSIYPPDQETSPVLLYSPDGLVWSAIDLSTVTDMSNRLVTGLMLTGDRVLVTVREMTNLEDRDAPLPGSTVLVGTLA